MLRKLPIVGVFGQGTPVNDGRAALARATGDIVARLGAHLLTGGGYGIMASVAEGLVNVPERAGLSIGIVPRAPEGAFGDANRGPGGEPYPNPFVEIAIITPPPRTEDWQHIPSRNHINFLTAHAIIALPGGVGTQNELTMAAAYLGQAELQPEARHTVLVGPPNEFLAEHLAGFVHAATLEEGAQHLVRILRREGFSADHEIKYSYVAS